MCLVLLECAVTGTGVASKQRLRLQATKSASAPQP